jgi:hypothetical protein
MRKIGIVVFALAILTAAVPVGATVQTEWTVDVLSDAYIDDWGIDGVVLASDVHNTNALYAGTGTLSNGLTLDSRSVMIFDVSPYWGLTLGSASLLGSGKSLNPNEDPMSVQLSSFISDHATVVESDFNETAASAGSFQLPYTSFDGILINSPFQVNVTSIVQSALDNQQQYLAFRVQADVFEAYISAGESVAAFPTDYERFGVKGPRLQLNAVPEPVSGLLFLVGGAVLVGRARRRGRKT